MLVFTAFQTGAMIQVSRVRYLTPNHALLFPDNSDACFIVSCMSMWFSSHMKVDGLQKDAKS